MKGREPWSFRNGKRDADTTLPADDPACKPIDYPKSDGVLSFDLLNNLALSGVKHEHDQPAHLRVKEGMETVASEVMKSHGSCPQKMMHDWKPHTLPPPLVIQLPLIRRRGLKLIVIFHTAVATLISIVFGLIEVTCEEIGGRYG